MATKKLKNAIHEFLSIQVVDFIVHVNAGINYEVIEQRYAQEDSPIHSFKSDIEITGVCLYPDDRASVPYIVNIYGHERNSKKLKEIYKDYYVRNQNGSVRYKKRKDGYIPVCEPPKSIGYIEKRRGKNLWTACAFVDNQTITDMLVLLCKINPLYLSIHEVKEGRHRQVRSITLQNSDPALE